MARPAVEERRRADPARPRGRVAEQAAAWSVIGRAGWEIPDRFGACSLRVLRTLRVVSREGASSSPTGRRRWRKRRWRKHVGSPFPRSLDMLVLLFFDASPWNLARTSFDPSDWRAIPHRSPVRRGLSLPGGPKDLRRRRVPTPPEENSHRRRCVDSERFVATEAAVQMLKPG